MARYDSQPPPSLFRTLRGPILTLLLILLGWNASANELVTEVPAQRNIELLQWAVTQGGLVVVILVVVWSYRRDFQRVFSREDDKSHELIIALQASSTAMTSHAEMMRENAHAAREQAKAFSELAGRVQACELARQIFEDKKG